ncbi:MAG: type II secretion system protein [bacterium]
MKTKTILKTLHGFTLIEILIVVAVIGVLAAIGSANYFEAIERADAAACQQNLRTIHSALMSYRADYNRFPPADGVADNKPQPDHTIWGCGPSANGYWSGVSLLLVEHGYCSEESLYCPALKRMYSRPVDAYPTCSESEFCGKQGPQWRFLRYAYNSAATDVGGYEGGEHNIEKDWDSDVWLVRCANVDVGRFDKDRDIRFPFRVKQDEEEPHLTWYGEFELTIHGTIRLRPVQLRQ